MTDDTRCPALVTEDTSRAPIEHVRGWHTYDASFKLSGRRGVRSITFFAHNDFAAFTHADIMTDNMADELCTSAAVVLAFDMKVTRRVVAPSRLVVSPEDREASAMTRLHRGMCSH